MTYQHKANADFVHYLESMVNLDTLDRMTAELDDELKDSQNVMAEIKGMFVNLATNLPIVEEKPNIDKQPKSDRIRSESPKVQSENIELHPKSEFVHVNVNNFLSSEAPNLLLPDMSNDTSDLDLDHALATIESYTENIKSNFVAIQSMNVEVAQKAFEKLDVEQYAASLGQLSKKLANLKLNKSNNVCSRNAVLESKLATLSQEVNLFSTLVQNKATLSSATKSGSAVADQQHSSLYYNNLIEKLLSSINELSYLLHNKTT